MQQLVSTVTRDGHLELALREAERPALADHEVRIRVDAAPINPSDLIVVVAMADLGAAQTIGTGTETVLRAPIDPRVHATLAGRFDQALPVGNEGAGVVVETGAAPEARALAGKTVATWGGSMYAQEKPSARISAWSSTRERAPRRVRPVSSTRSRFSACSGRCGARVTARWCTPRQRRTSGQMLVKLCQNEDVALVNVVRKGAQVELLRGIGAKYVCNSGDANFEEDLATAIAETGATLGYDAIGGGPQAGQILAAMERAAVTRDAGVGRYGSSVHKQVYVYGGLDRGPTTFSRTFGLAWGIGGWLLPHYLESIDAAEAAQMRQRVADEIHTTFASHYTDRIALTDVLDADRLRAIAQTATGRSTSCCPRRAGLESRRGARRRVRPRPRRRTSMTTVGLAGVGSMGVGMVENLLAAGLDVRLWNRTPERADAASKGRAVLCATPAELARGCDVVLSVLADDPSTEAVALGGNGLVEGLAPDAVHACMATISVALGKRLGATHAEAGQGYVSAPVFGRPPAAAAGQLFVVAAGGADALARCEPAFAAVGQRTFAVGSDPEAANIVKISGNFMLASLIETLGEAFALTRSHGIDPDQFLEVLTGSIFPAPVYKAYGGMIAKDRYEPPGFKLPLGLKDVTLALDAARDRRVPLPIGGLVRERFLTALARGYDGFDWAGLGRVCAEDAGLPPLEPAEEA